MDGGDESNFVASDIKHREFLNLIGLGKTPRRCAKFKKRLLRMIVYQRARDDLVSGVFVRELIQALPSNDMH
jgi:hypothetical protein